MTAESPVAAVQRLSHEAVAERAGGAATCPTTSRSPALAGEETTLRGTMIACWDMRITLAVDQRDEGGGVGRCTAANAFRDDIEPRVRNEVRSTLTIADGSIARQADRCDMLRRSVQALGRGRAPCIVPALRRRAARRTLMASSHEMRSSAEPPIRRGTRAERAHTAGGILTSVGTQLHGHDMGRIGDRHRAEPAASPEDADASSDIMALLVPQRPSGWQALARDQTRKPGDRAVMSAQLGSGAWQTR